MSVSGCSHGWGGRVEHGAGGGEGGKEEEKRGGGREERVVSV